MSLFSVFKRNARLALRGYWGRAVVVMLIFGGASLVLYILRAIATDIFGSPAGIDPVLAARYGVNDQMLQHLMATSTLQIVIMAVFVVLTVLLLAPLSLGTVHFHNQLVYGREPAIADVFRFFESLTAYRRAVWYEIVLTVRCLLWALLLYLVPGAIYAASMFTLVRADESAQRSLVAMASVGMLLAGLLFLLATVFFIAIINRYVLTAYLLCLDDTITVRQAIKTSVRYTAGYRFSILLFQLTFIGWILLCFFFFPVFYVLPYLRTATAIYARYIIEKNGFAAVDATKEFVVEAPTEEAPATEASEPVRENPFDVFREPRADSATDNLAPVDSPDGGSPVEEPPATHGDVGWSGAPIAEPTSMPDVLDDASAATAHWPGETDERPWPQPDPIPEPPAEPAEPEE